eukprot:jgi/Botrbrau1/4319/Bobra.0232s0011.1
MRLERLRPHCIISLCRLRHCHCTVHVSASIVRLERLRPHCILSLCRFRHCHCHVREPYYELVYVLQVC